MAHPNEDLLRRGYAAYNSADLDTVQALMADDIVWHAGGSNQATGEYRGFQQIMGLFGKVIELTGGGTFRTQPHDVLANDTHGVVLVTFHAERTGRRWRCGRLASGIWPAARPPNTGPSLRTRPPLTSSSADPRGHGLFVPKPSHQACRLSLSASEVQRIVRPRPLASAAGDSRSYSLGYSPSARAAWADR